MRTTLYALGFMLMLSACATNVPYVEKPRTPTAATSTSAAEKLSCTLSAPRGMVGGQNSLTRYVMTNEVGYAQIFKTENLKANGSSCEATYQKGKENERGSFQVNVIDSKKRKYTAAVSLPINTSAGGSELASVAPGSGGNLSCSCAIEQ
jgi:hypothetical protein